MSCFSIFSFKLVYSIKQTQTYIHAFNTYNTDTQITAHTYRHNTPTDIYTDKTLTDIAYITHARHTRLHTQYPSRRSA